MVVTKAPARLWRVGAFSFHIQSFNKVTMYAYRTVKCNDAGLEETLNNPQDGEEVFQVLPTISFTPTKIVMGVNVPLPGEVEYMVVFRKTK